MYGCIIAYSGGHLKNSSVRFMIYKCGFPMGMSFFLSQTVIKMAVGKQHGSNEANDY